MGPRAPSHPNGLCDSCAHQQLVPNTRGSIFSLCLRSRTDERYPRYPPVPVASCSGYESLLKGRLGEEGAGGE